MRSDPHTVAYRARTVSVHYAERLDGAVRADRHTPMLLPSVDNGIFANIGVVTYLDKAAFMTINLSVGSDDDSFPKGDVLWKAFKHGHWMDSRSRIAFRQTRHPKQPENASDQKAQP